MTSLRRVDPRRLVAAALVTVLVAAGTSVAATTHGYHNRAVSFDDGGIWTAQATSGDAANPGSFVGRANVQAGEIDTALDAQPRPQLLQDGPRVVFHDAATGALNAIDTVLGTTGAPLRLPPLVAPPGTRPAGAAATTDTDSDPAVDLNEAGEVGLGGNTVGVLDQGAGKLYSFPADGLPSGPLATQRSAATVSRGSRLVVGLDGVIHVVSPAGAVDDYSAGGIKIRHSDLGADLSKTSTPGAPFTVSAVGGLAVVLDGSGGLYVEGHRGQLTSVSDGDGPRLQQPGAARAGVLVATGGGLRAVDLRSGRATVLVPKAGGAPVAPVFVAERGCAYAAWAGSPAVAPDASTTGRPATGPSVAIVCDSGRHYAGPGEDNAIWRVNHGSALLNDQLTGKNLFFDGLTPVAIDDWSQAQRPSKGVQTATSTSTTVDDTPRQPHPAGPDQAPQARDDEVATRPGQPLVARVLANDTDPDQDVLAVTALSGTPPASGGTVAIVDGGSAIQITPPATGTAPISFGYTVDDGRGLTSSARVTVAIHPLPGNAAPLVPTRERVISVVTGGHITVDLLRDASDPDGDALTLAGATLPAGTGTVATTGGGLAVVSPTTTGSIPLSFSVADGRGRVTIGTQPLQVEAVGSAVSPSTEDDNLRTTVGVAGFPDVFANDSDGNDVDGRDGHLTLTAIDHPPGVNVVELGGGRLSVTPAAVGTTLINYTATDGAGESSAILRVDASQPDPGQPIVAVRDDVALRPAATAVVPVLANDIDGAGRVLVVSGVADVPAGVTVSQSKHETLSVTTAVGLAGPVSFTYTVSDGVASATGTVMLRPAADGPDQPPVATAATVDVRAGNAIPIDVLAADFDPEGEAVTLGDVPSLPAGQGQLFAEAGELRYLAPATPIGAVSTSYAITDSADNVSTGQLTIHVLPPDSVNRPPVPPEVVARVYTGQAVTVALPLFGSDPDGDVTTLAQVAPLGLGSPVLGSVGTLGSARFVFTAGGAGGTQELGYQVRDAGGLLATGVVRIGIVAPPATNSAPVALPDAVDIAPGATRVVAALANDSDPDGDVVHLDADQLTSPGSGRVAVAGDQLTVTAPAGVADGTKLSIGYGIDDGRGGTAASTVTETVTSHPRPQPPVAVDDLLAPQRTGTAVTVGVLANDTVPGGAASATVTAAGGPAVAVAPGGSLRFTMPATPAEFSYTVTDAAGQTASALVLVPLAGGLPPVAGPDSATTTAGQPVTVDVLANDSDPQGLPLTLTRVVSSSGGQARVAAGRVTFTPASGATGLGGFSYLVSDGPASATGSATVTITSGPDHPPVAAATALRVSAGGSVTLDLVGDVTDQDTGDRLSFSGLSGSVAGVQATLSGSRLTVRASTDARGRGASLRYSVSDGHPKGLASGVVTVAVISSTKPLPQAVGDTASTVAGRTVGVPVLANDIDPLGQGLHIVSVSPTAAGATAVAGRNVSFTPGATFHGTATFGYVLGDATGDPTRQASATIRVSVIGVPGAPGNPSGTPADHQVTLRWAPPTNNGSPITGYTVTYAGGSRPCPRDPCVIAGLADGHDYAFTVTATNAAGTGPASGSSGPVRVDRVPDAPGAPTATAGNGKISVTWPAPAGEGSTPTGYTVTASPGGMKQTATATAATFDGLTNGTAYTFVVTATNAVGTSAPSAASSPTTPAGPPGAPGAPRASTSPDAASAVAAWNAADDNGSPVTAYTLEVFSDGALRDTIAEKDTSHLTDTVAASNGHAYSFAVSATNAVGTSAFSPRSNSVTETGRPAQVGAVSAVAGNSQGTLTFDPPADNGSAIDHYVVADSTGGSHSLAPADRVVTPLSNGTSYTFTVAACNAVGCGPASGASNAVTPFTVPSKPTLTGFNVIGNTLQWNWSSNGDGGSPITKWAYKLDTTDFVGTTDTSFAHTFDQCGMTYYLLVHADNAAGASQDSDTVYLKTAACSH